MKKLLALTMATLSINAYARDEVLVIPYNENGHVNERAEIKAMFKFKVRNTSGRDQNYVVTERIVVNGKEWKDSWGFNLKNNSNKEYEKLRSMDFTPPTVGSYRIEGKIVIAGQPSLVHENHATLEVR